MFKFLITISLTFLLTGCFSVSSLNPFSNSKEEEKSITEKTTINEEIDIPSDAPKWLVNTSLRNNITSIGIAKVVDEEKLDFYKQKALIAASNNLLKKIYFKTGRLYKAYTEKLDNQKFLIKI